MRCQVVATTLLCVCGHSLLTPGALHGQEGTWRVQSVVADFGGGPQNIMEMQGIDSVFLYIDGEGVIQASAFGADEDGDLDVMGTLTRNGDDLVFDMDEDDVDSTTVEYDGNRLVLRAFGTDGGRPVTLTITAGREPSQRESAAILPQVGRWGSATGPPPGRNAIPL